MESTDVCVGWLPSQSIRLAGRTSHSAISLPASTANDNLIWCSSWDSHTMVLEAGT